MTISERLRIVRGHLGQVEFAKKIGSSQTGVSAYENGQRKPDYETLIRVSQVFGVTLDWLLLGTGPMYKTHEGVTENKTTDISVVLSTPDVRQPIENVESQKNHNADMSVVTASQQALSKATRKTMELQDRLLGAHERIASLLEDKAELQVSLERAMMNVERRDMRIRELERELDALKEARKGIARAQDQIGQLAG